MGELKSIKKTKLTPTQAKVVKAKIKAELTNKSQAEVAHDLFPNQTPRAAEVTMSRELKKANVQDALEIAMAQYGLTADSLVDVVGAAMTANRVVQIEGDFYETEVADHNIRLKAAGMAANWMGVGKNSEGETTNFNFINMSKTDNHEFGI